MKRAYPETTYERWMKEEGLPVVTGHGVAEILALPRAPWRRRGGAGTFIKLMGMEGMTGMYVGEVPSGGVLHPEKHLYDEFIYILGGRGSTEVYAPGAEERKSYFEWQTGSLFAIPVNAWYRLFNASGTEPAVFLGFTTAPVMMDLFGNPDFIFGCDYPFTDRFDARDDYFAEQSDRYLHELAPILTRDTNFVFDVRSASLDPGEYKAPGRRSTLLEMVGSALVSHIAEWPGGRHDKAHHHSGGAVLLIVRGSGYSLMWPKSAGTQPYQSGHGDEVVTAYWQEGSVFSPPSGWFHQHFNTGAVPARQLALRYGTRKRGVEFADVQRAAGTHVSTRQGGTLVEYEDQDPEIARQFERACAETGTAVQMPRLNR